MFWKQIESPYTRVVLTKVQKRDEIYTTIDMVLTNDTLL